MKVSRGEQSLYVTIWDDDVTIKTNCLWHDDLEAASEIEAVEVERLDVLKLEYVELADGTQIEVFFEREAFGYIPSAGTEWPDEWLDNWEVEWKKHGDDMACPWCNASAIKTLDRVTACYDCDWSSENRVAR